MSSYSGEQIYSVPSAPANAGSDRELVEHEETLSNTKVFNKFKQFVRNFRDDHDQFIYRDQLLGNFRQGRTFLEIDLTHILTFDPELHTLLQTNPANTIPILENAVKQVLLDVSGNGAEDLHIAPYQVVFKNYPKFTDLRKLSAADITHLIAIRGIITSASKPRVKATNLCIMCRSCHSIKRIKGGSGLGNVQIPRQCDAGVAQQGGRRCPVDPYIIISDDSEYFNVQTLKLQEAPDAVPTGEMPRHVTLNCERYLIDQVKPGTRVTVIGVHMTYTAKQPTQERRNGVQDVGIRIPYVRVLGIEQENEASDIMMGKLSAEDQQEVLDLVAYHDNIYEAVARSIAPAIMGRDDIKKAIACTLFGGSRKLLPDGMRLRGDINVLLLGDPSVAKSQFLKFANQVAPISVYTSGKGSSAAGLTASVVRNPGTGEFALEGGALVLADGGLVCIDEFDKMRDQDRVAIHEAMEQQTISIAKAGITTILNSRTAVLAAANPVFGRYDDTKDATDNINFQATILSRFDLIFIIRDMQDEVLDQELAHHIINVHTRGDATLEGNSPDVIEIGKLKKLIAYARRIQPRLSEDAAEMLQNNYVKFRQDMAAKRREERENPNSSGTGQVIPITVRQMEAIVRISESIARMSLSPVATEDHVTEALRLFKVATLQAASTPMGETINSEEFKVKLIRAQRWYENRVPMGHTVNTRDLMRDIVSAGHDERAAKRAMEILVQQRSFVYEKQRKQIKRVLVDA